MPVVNMRDACADLSRLVDRALAGEDVIIARAGEPVARIVPVEPLSARRPGSAKGRVTDAFFDPLPPEELDAWNR